MSQNENRLGELYRSLGGRLHATALRLLRSPEEAEDAVQDAFLQFHRQGSGFDPAAAGAWLHRVVVNRSLDRLRSRSRWRQEEATDLSMPAQRPAPISTRLDLERAVATLPEGARRVFLLHDVEGFRHGEVATLLGISEGTSKSQLFRAREILRGALGGRAVEEAS